MIDLVVRDARVLTQSTAMPHADAFAVRRGRIVAVGADVDVGALGDARTTRVSLGGATVVPGLIDAHSHIWKIGHLLTSMVDLRAVHSLAELGARLRTAAAHRPAGAWLLGRGYNEAALVEGRGPTRHDLDAAVPDRPVMLTRTCGHIVALNGPALARCGITRDTPPPSGGEIERTPDGEPTGVLRETAMGLALPHVPAPTAHDHREMIGAALRHQRALGITSTSDAGVAPALLDVYRGLEAERALPIHVNLMALRKVDGLGTVPLPAVSASDRLRIDTVKFLADGGLSGATAALSVPYRDSTSTGVLRFEDDELLALAREAHEAGFRIATHAIGDVAIEQVLRVYEALGAGPKRHRVEHLGLPSPAQLRRLAPLGVMAAPQTVFLHALGRNFRVALPDAMLRRTYPVREMIDAGLTVALSSDAPVVEDDSVFRGIQSAVDRCDDAGDPIAPEQAITAREALHAYTMGGALASGDDADRGSIEAGKWADFAVLSADPLSCATEALSAIRVDQTWVAGQLAYER